LNIMACCKRHKLINIILVLIVIGTVFIASISYALLKQNLDELTQGREETSKSLKVIDEIAKKEIENRI